MAKTVLVINSGSSSIKYQLVDVENGDALAPKGGDGSKGRPFGSLAVTVSR